MTDKYKKFDLARALAGDKFVRQYDEATPTDWHYFEERKEIVCEFGINQDLALHNCEGERRGFPPDHKLVFPIKTKKLWISIEKKPYKIGSLTGCAYHTTDAFDQKEEALREDCNIIEIEVEE